MNTKYSHIFLFRFNLLVSTWIFLIAIILLQQIHELLNFRILSKQETLTFTYLIQNISASCWYQNGYVLFEISRCEAYEIGQRIIVFGSLDEVTDKALKRQIVLKNESISKIAVEDDSVKDWRKRIKEQIFHIRLAKSRLINSFFAFPRGEIIDAFVFGVKPQLSPEFSHKIKVIGIQHLIVASGFNISVVLGMVFFLLKQLKITSKIGFTASWLAIILYCLISGFSEPLLRAVSMASLSLGARFSATFQYRANYGLWLSGVLLIIIQPQLLFSVSFQLSFLATLGVITWMPLWSNFSTGWSQLVTNDFSTLSRENKLLRSWWRYVSGFIWESLLISLAAQSFVLPVVWYQFQELSLLSMVSNVLLGWLAPLITTLGLVEIPVLAVLGIWPSLQLGVGILFESVVWLPVKMFVMGTEWLGRYEWSLISLPQMPEFCVFAWWLGLGVVLAKINSHQSKPSRLELSHG